MSECSVKLESSANVVHEIIQFPSSGSFRVLRWEKDVSEVWWVVSPREQRPVCGEGKHWHYHRFLELTFFEEGRGTRFVGDRIESFEDGDLVLLGESLPHYWETQKRSSGVSVQWHFPATHPFWALPGAETMAAHFNRAVRGIHYRGATAGRLSRLLHNLMLAEGLAQFALLVQLIAESAAAPEADARLLASRAFCLTQNSPHHGRMLEAIRHVLTHYRDPIGMNDLLKITRMSKPTFCRHFKTHTGKTLGGFIQDVRLHTACRQLANSDMPIIDVAYFSGFSQLSFFNRLFRRTVGCSPSVYRQRAKSAMQQMEGEGGRNEAKIAMLPLPPVDLATPESIAR
jgi:AraC-like DNA-binding protein/mannose-6-phosphate isomerase-like protein (cupin superfamily)